MIFLTVNQLTCFLLFLFLGIIFALIFNLIKIIFCFNFLKNITKNIFKCVFFSIFAIIFIFFINFFNFGKISISLLLGTILGYVWFDKLATNSVVFLQNKWYNTVKHKDKKKIKTNESKLKS